MRAPKGIVQVAGVLDAQEARMLLDCGADLLGFPLKTPGNDEITEDRAREIIRSLNLENRSVLITYLNRAESLADLCGRLGVKMLQVHSEISPEEARRLRKTAPDLFIIKSLIVGTDNVETLEAAVRDFSDWVDAFITDTLDPQTGARGATGNVHNWAVSRRIVERSPRPVILAGGLCPENVARAVAVVRPWGVDAHTRLEGPRGRKDPLRVQSFVRRAREALSRAMDREGETETVPGPIPETMESGTV
ncbi:MAG TPA: phosphoribosylanthranilate isomerase [Syntrophobacteraceae bacterium]|nr:phosphoribosylanthranilate isomerase [Syntrophobacteraceae bacterium]